MATTAPGRSYSSEIPFHAPEEGYAKVYSVLAVTFALVDIALPLLGLHRSPWPHTVRMIAVALLCVSVLMTYRSIYKRLGKRIALGGDDAIFLDRLRRDVSSMVTFAFSLGWILWSAGLFTR